MQHSLHEYSGPNIHAPTAGVLLNLSPRSDIVPDWEQIERHWQQMADDRTRLRPADSHQMPAGIASLIVALTRLLYCSNSFFQDDHVLSGFDEAERREWVFLRDTDRQTAQATLKLAIEIATILLSQQDDSVETLPFPEKGELAALRRQIDRHTPHEGTQLLMCAARERNIPFYPVSRGKVWQFGQGTNGKHFLPSANEGDSFTGASLTSNKMFSNDLVLRLGLPGVRHGVAQNAAQAMQLAEKLGYPIVIKPIGSGLGLGITAGITDASEIGPAVQRALEYTRRGVLVEGHVDGTDHRLAVFGGKLAWAGARHPARIFGDGRQTILQLIAEENHRRTDDSDAMRIEPDQDMERWLAKSARRLTDCPAMGEEIRLRSVANLSKGGTWEELTEIHPDNIAMAETLAAAFRMAAMGIDFISPDLSRSWRDVPCAVIEVNETPLFTNLSQARRILENTIPENRPVRIPSVLVVDCTQDCVEFATQVISSGGSCVGVATETEISLGNQSRRLMKDGLKARVDALILDPGCEAIVVAARAESLLTDGLPLDRFDLIVRPPSLTDPLKGLLDRNCREIFVFNHGETDTLGGVLDGVAGERGRCEQPPATRMP